MHGTERQSFEVTLRPETRDNEVVAEMVEYESMRFLADDVVLDIGGHIGLFARFAYERGVSRVWSVEPDAANAELHRKNLSDFPQHLLLQAAVVGGVANVIPLFTNPGRNKARHTILPTADYGQVQVAAINFCLLVHMVRPTVLKVDCEGAEYNFYWAIQSHVRELAVEFHELPNRNAQRDAIISDIIHRGFNLTYKSEERPYMLYLFRRQ